MKLKKLITNKTKIIAVTHISNVTGAIMPIKKIVDLAKRKNSCFSRWLPRCATCKNRHARTRL